MCNDRSVFWGVNESLQRFFGCLAVWLDQKGSPPAAKFDSYEKAREASLEEHTMFYVETPMLF